MYQGFRARVKAQERQNEITRLHGASDSDRKKLFRAISLGKTAEVGALLQGGGGCRSSGISPNVSNIQKTALQEAIEADNINIVQLLLKAGANVNQQPFFCIDNEYSNLISNLNGETALMTATRLKRIEILKLLVQIPGIQHNRKKSNSSQTPLYEALINRDLASAKLLLTIPGVIGESHYSVDSHMTAKEVSTVKPWLILAMDKLNNNDIIDLIKFLINLPGFNINLQSDFSNKEKNYQQKNSALHYALSNFFNIEILKLLAKAPGIDANQYSYTKDQGKETYHTPLTELCDGMNYPITQEKMNTLLTIPGINVNLQSNGHAALHYCVIKNNADRLQDLMKAPAELNVDLNQHNWEGFTPLMLAVKNNFEDILKHLLADNRVNINILSRDESTSALHLAVTLNNEKLLPFLLENKKININIENKEQKTPLILAAKEGYFSIVKILVKAGADISLFDKEGDAIYHARKAGHQGIVDFLQKAKSAQVETREREALAQKQAEEREALEKQQKLEQQKLTEQAQKLEEEKFKREQLREEEKRREEKERVDRIAQEKLQKQLAQQKERDSFTEKVAVLEKTRKSGRYDATNLNQEYNALLSDALRFNDDNFYVSRGSFYYDAAVKETSNLRKEALCQNARDNYRQALTYDPFMQDLENKIKIAEELQASIQKAATPIFFAAAGASNKVAEKQEELSDADRRELEEIKQRLRAQISNK